MPHGRPRVGHALGMAPRIDPALPLVWRTPTDVQLGATTARVVLRDAGDLEIGLIAALRHGASVETLRTIGAGLGGAIVDVERLLAALEPAFEPVSRGVRHAATPAGARAERQRRSGGLTRGSGAAGRHGRRRRSARRASHRRSHRARVPRDDAVRRRRRDLHDEDAADDTALAVVAATWAIPPSRHLPWLRRDVPHLAVVFDDTGARVGPLVEPGAGPCLRCLDLGAPRRRPRVAGDRGPAGGPPGRDRDRRAPRIEAATLAVALVDDRLAHGSTAMADASLTLSRERPAGSPRRLRHAPHPECGCRAPGGTATAPVHLDVRRRREARSASAGAVPA